MPKLVAPDGIMYVFNDTGPDQADLAERRADPPPKKNLNQLLGWCGPAGVTSQAPGSYWTKSRGQHHKTGLNDPREAAGWTI